MIRQTFINAFKAQHSGFRGDCNCGREFYNPADCWDFEDSEIKWLEETDATMLEHDVQYIELNNREYVIDCDCWVHIANKMVDYIDRHDQQIAKYLNSERERKICEAEQVQLIDILSKPPEENFDDDIPF